MSLVAEKKINPNFIKEYRYFLENYVLKILGVDNQKLLDDIRKSDPKIPTIIQEDSYIHFNSNGWRLFSLEHEQIIPQDNLKLIRRIIQSFFKITEYKRTGSGKNNNYFSEIQKATVYDMAIQKGICNWIAGDKDNGKVEELFNKLETWAVKTYEGKKVTFGFIINTKKRAKTDRNSCNWLEFLDDDSSAVLTDCIHTVIELDIDCNFLGYHSISDRPRSEKKFIPQCELSNKIPLRFAQVIREYVVENKIGIFLLNNGDIILAKNREVRFVKRNLRWLNLSYNAFSNSLKSFTDKYKSKDSDILKNLIENTFASVLDVSFSHAGGIISIVGNTWPKSIVSDKYNEDSILNPWDDLLNGLSCDKLCELESKSSSCKPKEHEVKKRIQKRTVLQHLTQNKSFMDLDRKLRGELIALDGACILNHDGNIISFGAIIQNDSGSTSGGRGAAAKKLSNYGMAVKISTDGYIELYVEGEVIYAIK